MANRRIEMQEYRQALYRMRLSESDRQINKDMGLGRPKLKHLRSIAAQKKHDRGWGLAGMRYAVDEKLEINRLVENYHLGRGFRVLKSEIEIAPAYHRLPERIKAHAMLCFIALII